MGTENHGLVAAPPQIQCQVVGSGQALRGRDNGGAPSATGTIAICDPARRDFSDAPVQFESLQSLCATVNFRINAARGLKARHL